MLQTRMKELLSTERLHGVNFDTTVSTQSTQKKAYIHLNIFKKYLHLNIHTQQIQFDLSSEFGLFYGGSSMKSDTLNFFFSWWEIFTH